MKATVILPAFNEDKAIGHVIQGIRALHLGCDILVIDNASTDMTSAIAKALGARVLRESRKGKGMAVRAGIKNANNTHVVMMDADNTYPGSAIPDLLKCLRDGCEVVVGYRYWRERGSMSLVNWVGNLLLSLLARVLYGYGIKDVCSGMWAFTSSALNKFNLTSRGFTLEADLFTNAVACGCRLDQVPIEYRPRPDGSRAKLSVWDGFRIAWFLVKRRFWR